MRPTDRTRLTSALRDHVARIATDLRAKLREEGPARARAKQLHSDEQVGEDFDVWTDLLSRRAAVLWVLKSVYVRVLEDKGLLSPGRILDPESQQLFEKLAPNLGESAFLRWIYRDLASSRGGLPELFAPQPAEVAVPADKLSRELIEFWRHRDPDTNAHWSFAEERFEGELMGDLYQELDPVVKERFALCQTPDFVRAFILDRTLTPAIETFGADTVRLLDPACGSGHFLIDGLKRLVVATAEKHKDWDKKTLVRHCLDRVVGMDLNDYACALARARLVMTAAELAGVSSLAEASALHPHVYWADGLEQVERDEVKPSLQFDLFEKVEEKPRATLTRSDVRAALRKVFADKFHAVVANPPYITEKDAARKEYHREKVGKTPRYVSAYREYSLGSPFTERCFQLAVPDGYVGLITGNNFLKREFGKPLIEKVLAGLALSLVVDTSQAYIPFHGTPTVLLFGRNRQPSGEYVRAVMGKRGETGTPADPAHGHVWSSIEQGWNTVGFENDFVSVADVPRRTFDKHPWSLGGGGAAELKEQIEAKAYSQLSKVAVEIGYMCMTRADEIYFMPRGALHRARITDEYVATTVEGDRVRDWSILEPNTTLFPYNHKLEPVQDTQAPAVHRFLWPFRTMLWLRREPNGNHRELGLTWWEWSRFQRNRFRIPLSIAFAEVATHNHFVLDRGGKIFKQTAPVVKLPEESTEADHLKLLGILNSSVACFWMKQIFQAKAGSGIGRGIQPESWMERYQFDSTKMRLFPIAAGCEQTLPYATRLDDLARKRTARTVAGLLSDHQQWSTAASLKAALESRRRDDLQELSLIVALQEELDWLNYRLYGVDDKLDILSPEQVEGVRPNWLPWALNLAEHDAKVRAGLSPDEMPTAWFERHGWEPLQELPPEVSERTRVLVQSRRERIRSVPGLGLLEKPVYKRRWYKPDYEAEEKTALQTWLADQIEASVRVREQVLTLDKITVLLQDNRRVLAVAEVLAQKPDFNLLQLVLDAVQQDCVPNHSFHIYKGAGPDKRAAWEKTWDAQRREDVGEALRPDVPPPYEQGDFLRLEYWQLRGKLDVPKERFIAFTEIPNRDASNTLYGWAGWTPLQRLKALLSIDEELEDAGVPLADRIGVLDSAWRLLPDVAREDPAAANRLKAELQALVGTDGPSREQLEDWRQRFPPPGTKAARSAGKKKS